MRVLPDGHDDGDVDDEEAYDAAHSSQNDARWSDGSDVVFIPGVEVVPRYGAMERIGWHHVVQWQGLGP